MALVKSVVVLLPPKSLVRIFPSRNTSLIELNIIWLYCNKLMWRNIFEAQSNMAHGLAMFLPTASEKVCLAPLKKIITTITRENFTEKQETYWFIHNMLSRIRSAWCYTSSTNQTRCNIVNNVAIQIWCNDNIKLIEQI